MYIIYMKKWKDVDYHLIIYSLKYGKMNTKQ